MKLALSLLLIGALCALGLLVPLEGETGLSRARREGWPAACAQTLGKTALLGFRWAERALRGSPGATPPPQKLGGPRRRLARAAPEASPASSVASARPSRPALTDPPAAAGAQRDHILAAPPSERFDGKDRSALDKLIAARQNAGR